MFYFILACIVVFAILGFIIYCQVRKGQYIKFVNLNSVALEQMRDINKRYIFNNVNRRDLDLYHSYDNDNFFYDISCQDYLIYNLQFMQKKMSDAMKKISSNKSNYVMYQEEIKEFVKFGEFKQDIGRMKKNKLTKIEKRLFDSMQKKAVITFSVYVELILTNIEGRYITRKYATFDEEDVRNLIRRLHDKNGDFYRDRDIWDAICRVERGKVSNKMRFAIYKRDHNRCCYCGRGGKWVRLEVDHIIPIAKGGKSTMDNLQTLCHDCNVKKGDKLM